MKENKDRIAIIDAIQSASSDELEALAEIKKAIMSNIVVSNSDNSHQGKVSRRLSRTQNNRQSKTGSNSARDQQNVYEERLPPKKKPLRMTTASSSAVVTDYPQRKERRNNTDKRTATVPLISQSPASSPKKRAHRQAGLFRQKILNNLLHHVKNQHHQRFETVTGALCLSKRTRTLPGGKNANRNEMHRPNSRPDFSAN